jgi:peptidoglycan biosynthesis protein MviN/MurJ (putative lipid II flippase)
MLLCDRMPLASLVEGAGELRLGPVGLALGSSLAAWAELALLARRLRLDLEPLRLPWGSAGRSLGAALLAALPAAAVWALLPPWHEALQALVVLPLYGALYLIAAARAGVPEARLRLPW